MSAPPFFAAPWEPADAYALQALARGEASPEMQKRALDWVINSAARTYDSTFFPGQPDASAFAQGRRYVGQQVVKLLVVNTATLIDKENING